MPVARTVFGQHESLLCQARRRRRNSRRHRTPCGGNPLRPQSRRHRSHQHRTHTGHHTPHWQPRTNGRRKRGSQRNPQRSSQRQRGQRNAARSSHAIVGRRAETQKVLCRTQTLPRPRRQDYRRCIERSLQIFRCKRPIALAHHHRVALPGQFLHRRHCLSHSLGHHTASTHRRRATPHAGPPRKPSLHQRRTDETGQCSTQLHVVVRIPKLGTQRNRNAVPHCAFHGTVYHAQHRHVVADWALHLHRRVALCRLLLALTRQCRGFQQ